MTNVTFDNPKKRKSGHIAPGGVMERKLDYALMFEMLESGSTRSDVARKFGVSASAVTQAIKRARSQEFSPPAIAANRREGGSLTPTEPSDRFRSDQIATLFESMRMCAGLPRPSSFQQLVQRETALKLVLDRGKVLLGWDAKAGGNSGAINISGLSGHTTVNLQSVTQTPAKPTPDHTLKMCDSDNPTIETPPTDSPGDGAEAPGDGTDSPGAAE